MELPIRRVDKDIPLPEYKTPGAAAMDCSVRDDVVIAPKSIGYAHLNFALKPPAGHFVAMAARSSLHKRGLIMANGLAIFDEDYCGDEDEYKVIFYNFTDEPVTVSRGDRVTQIIVLPYDKVSWNEVTSLGNPSRGGIGSTGVS
jgi:dUTP pyrophosphatase